MGKLILGATDLVANALKQYIMQYTESAWAILKPVLITTAIVAGIGAVAKSILNWFFRITGNSKRQAMRKTNLAIDLIDLIRSSK